MVLEQYIANDYVRVVVIFLGLLILLRVVASILERIVLKFVKKTKTDLDDIILEKSSKPITLILLFISLRFALGEITINEAYLSNIYPLIYSLIAVAIGYLAYVLIDVVVFRAWNKVSKKVGIKTGQSLAHLIQGLLKFLLIVLVLLYILDLWGVEITPLLAGLGIAGLAIALALQPVLANIFSGVSMILDESIRVGDLVYLDANAKGKIKKIGLRSTRINTFDNELIIVPNTKLAESLIQNIALPEPKTRAVVPFSVAYGTDISKVKKIVMKEIKTITGFMGDPGPKIRFLEMADSSLNFSAYFYIESFENRADAIDEANTKIYNALNKNNIEIPFPQRDVHMKKK